MESSEEPEEQFGRMLKTIRRLDIALAYSWTGTIISAIVLVVGDLYAGILYVTNGQIEGVALAAINAVLGCLVLGLFLFSRRSAKKFHRLADDAKHLMKTTGVTLTGPLSIGPDGIVATGFRGRKTSIKWVEISAVYYDGGEICLHREKKRIALCYWTNFAGLPFELKDVAQGIMTQLPKEKWARAKEWLTLQVRSDEHRP